MVAARQQRRPVGELDTIWRLPPTSTRGRPGRPTSRPHTWMECSTRCLVRLNQLRAPHLDRLRPGRASPSAVGRRARVAPQRDTRRRVGDHQRLLRGRAGQGRRGRDAITARRVPPVLARSPQGDRRVKGLTTDPRAAARRPEGPRLERATAGGQQLSQLSCAHRSHFGAVRETRPSTILSGTQTRIWPLSSRFAERTCYGAPSPPGWCRLWVPEGLVVRVELRVRQGSHLVVMIGR